MSHSCSICEVEITLKEKEYSLKRFGIELCRPHQVTTASKTENGNVSKKTSNSGYSQTWMPSVIKGRIAETIVEELFKSLGFQVYKYGMEHSIPGIAELLRGIKDDVATNIRKMPDFVIFKDNRAHFLEVKFRKSGSFTIDDLDPKGDYPYHNALILLVSKDHIKCISYKELADHKEITPKCKNWLGSRKEFETDKETIKEYIKYTLKFFETVD
ncbi:MAG: hypothetical protein ABJF04_25725 [Reichenbachiella sp.]|uniref:hypothetical protein n=1 Tax=Reichenbachiella sp. TaxID=2184521 RepID=UPI003266A607